jgi:hypothetical protein
MKLFISLMLIFASLNVFADIVNKLPASDSLRKTTNAIATQLSDANITSGTTTLWSGKLKAAVNLKNKKALKGLVLEGFKDAFKDDTGDALPNDAKLEVTVGNFVDGENGDIAKMTDALMESNDYNTKNRELREGQARYLWVVLRKLPVAKDTVIGHVKTRMVDASSGSERSIQYFVLISAEKKAVQFFTIEGSM